MTATLLSLIILLCPLPQEQAKTPDLSTPEKAAKAWSTFWLGLQGKNPFTEVMQKVERAGLPAMTPAGAKRLEDRLAKQADMFRGNETLSMSAKVAAIEDGASGTKEVTLDVTRTFNQKNWRTKKVSKATETKPQKYVLVQVGKEWRIKQVFNPCFGCEAKGICGMCKGTGKRAGGKGDCFDCKGAKGCKRCKGKKFREEKLASIGMAFIKASVRLEVKQDFSTPQKAAETWILIQRKKELTASHFIAGYVRAAFKTMSTYLDPAMTKEIETQLAKGEAKATKRFLEKKPRLKSLEVEQDGTAYAVIATPAGGAGGIFGVVEVEVDGVKQKQPSESLSRVVLKKTGAKWLVDQLQSQCYSCEGKGKCKQCAQGRNPGGQCPFCKGTSKCRQCKGTGFTADRF